MKLWAKSERRQSLLTYSRNFATAWCPHRVCQTRPDVLDETTNERLILCLPVDFLTATPCRRRITLPIHEGRIIGARLRRQTKCLCTAQAHNYRFRQKQSFSCKKNQSGPNNIYRREQSLGVLLFAPYPRLRLGCHFFYSRFPGQPCRNDSKHFRILRFDPVHHRGKESLPRYGCRCSGSNRAGGRRVGGGTGRAHPERPRRLGLSSGVFARRQNAGFGKQRQDIRLWNVATARKASSSRGAPTR